MAESREKWKTLTFVREALAGFREVRNLSENNKRLLVLWMSAVVRLATYL